jgi:CheY-like chemotaxis protein
VVEPAALGSETILLVEDEDALRKLAAEVLRSHGYTVLEAGNGEDALRVCRAFASTIPLLITDMIMPGMNGRALAESLRDSLPQVKVLYISGYTENILDVHGSFGPGNEKKKKPFSPVVLAQKVRELLDHVA